MRISALSDVGLVRKNNEDSFFVCAPHLFVVADGMGGHEAGEVASKIAVTAIHDCIKNTDMSGDKQEILRSAIQEANRQIYTEAAIRSNCHGMGTTVSAVYIVDEVVYWAHVGDSRVYLIQDGTIQQLTEDHSLVWQLVKEGELSPDEANVHPQRNVLTRAVGTEPHLEIDAGEAYFRGGDQLLLCTDGLTNLVSEDELYDILHRTENAEETVQYLVRLAKDRGGYDNITVILLDKR